ncbi:MAG: hypothetical protein RMK57_11585 [Bryobacterales bacterium]|nr:hypothetical protein [Bryobacterales bacterium]
MRKLLPILLLAAVTPGFAGKRRERLAVPVWVEGERLEAGTLGVRLGGQAARVEAVRGPEHDLLLLVVLDLSGDVSLAETARDALARQVHQLPAHTWVSLMRAHEGLSVILDPTADRSAFEQAVRAAPPGRHAGFLESAPTVMDLADAILRQSGVRVAVLFVTDSDVRRYREDFANPVINASDPRDLSRHFPEALVQEKIRKLDRRMAHSEAPLFVVHLDYRSDRLNEAYQAGLTQLAATTGGASEFCRSQGEIAEAIGRALARIASHYSVVVAVPERTPKFASLDLRAPGRTLTYRPQVPAEER